MISQTLLARLDAQAITLLCPLLGLLLLVPFLKSRHSTAQGLKHIPLVLNTGRRSFRLSTYISYLTNPLEILQEAYNVYFKRGQTCCIPGFGFKKQIILPQSALRWMLDKPGAQLHLQYSVIDMLQARWTLGDPKYILETWPRSLLRAGLLRIDPLIQKFQDGLDNSIQRRFGSNTNEWREVNLYNAVKAIITQASARYLVGYPLCDNEEFIQSLLAFADAADLVNGTMRAIPSILHPILGPIVSIRRYLAVEKVKKHLRPVFNSRVEGLAATKAADNTSQDFLQDLIRYLHESQRQDLNLHHVTTHLLFYFLSACSQPWMLATQVIFNILDSNAEYNTRDKIQDELWKVFGAADGAGWNRAGAANLTHLDSILRESLRLNATLSLSMWRKVMVDDLVTPDGYTLPKGATVSFLSRPAYFDPKLYRDPHKFIPFRFLPSDPEAGPNAGKRFTTTSEDFLAWGYGRFGCPGRFLVEAELKMLVAHILTFYEAELPAEYGGKRPKATWVIDVIFPPRRGRILVKRKDYI